MVALMRRNADSPLFLHNCLEILQNGREKYPRLLADLKAAQHSIHMEYYEWSSDEVMQAFKRVLLERAKAGVEVGLMYDTVGSFLMLSRAYVREMNVGGIKMIPYSPLISLHRISYRNHRKIVIIDGKIGYTGGLNMAESYLKGPGATLPAGAIPMFASPSRLSGGCKPVLSSSGSTPPAKTWSTRPIFHP
jgi:cardiolipin synthase A/B